MCKLFSSILLIFIVIIAMFAIGEAKSEYFSDTETVKKQGSVILIPETDHAVHDIAKFGFTISNQGLFGNGFLSGVSGAPAFQYPYPNGPEYLFGGALWVGAIVGSDTLVSVGSDGWTFTREMWPDEAPNGQIIEENNGILQKFTTVYFDTLTDPALVAQDPIDNRPHIPLNIKITQTTYVWNIPTLEDFALMQYEIENIGDVALEEVMIGFFIDADVKQPNASNEYDDDISGFIKSTEIQNGSCFIEETLNLAWIADISGRDYMVPGDSCSFPAVTGMSIIRTPNDSLQVSFNWWASNFNPDLDWGPRLAGTAEDPFRDFGGNLGTPMGDKNKYYIMNHPEIDYDQIFAALDHSTDGWLPPHQSLGNNYADGWDAKYLLSFGPQNINPGEVYPFVVAYVAGENLHSAPCDAFENLFDHNNPDLFNNQLQFDDLTNNTILADWVYDNPGVDTDGDGYLGRFFVCASDSEFVFDPQLGDSVWVVTSADTVYYEGDGIPDFNPTPLLCADVNLDGSITVLDITSLIAYLYMGAAEPLGLEYADLNNSGAVNILDILVLINYLYYGGPKPICQ